MTTIENHLSCISFRVSIKKENQQQFIDWQAELNAKIVGAEGFISLEIFLFDQKEKTWEIVERFVDEGFAHAWSKSLSHTELMEALKKLSKDDQVVEISRDLNSMRGGITEILVAQISTEREEEYKRWSAKIHQMEATFPGFLGVFVQSPAGNGGRNWITFLQFDTAKNLDNWINSKERKELLKESQGLIHSLENHRIASAYSGWFSSIAEQGTLPPVWKQTMIVLLVLFPIVVFEIKYLSPLTSILNSSLATFIGNAISVSLIAFPFMPFALLFFGNWLASNNVAHKKKTIQGTIIILFLYLIEIVLFWHFIPDRAV